MQLSYHGATYSYEPQTVEMVETTIKCQFLGRKTMLRVAKQQTSERVRHDLKYRGVSYRA